MASPSAEQATVYECEDRTESEIGSRGFDSRKVDEWIETVCHAEDLDVPTVSVVRASRTLLASAHAESNSICIRGRRVTAGTLLHEIAHLSCGGDSHGVLFRDELVRLGRAHISLQWADHLHRGFVSAGLEMSPWPASARRPR